MTLLEWVSTWWRTTTPVCSRTPNRSSPDAAAGAARPRRVPSLYTYLEHRYASTVVLSFEQMEALLGFALPEAAAMERDWWMGAALRTAPHSDAWTVAKRTATPNLSARTFAFERLS